jgi:DNA-binding PadR family transcriptional regulator
MSYQLRRLRLHGFIKRRPGRNHYRLTDTGLQTAAAYTLAHDRVLRAGTAQISDPALPSELRRAYTRLAHQQSCLAT